MVANSALYFSFSCGLLLISIMSPPLASCLSPLPLPLPCHLLVSLLIITPLIHRLNTIKRGTNIQMPAESQTSSITLTKTNRPLSPQIKETTRRSPTQTNRSNPTARGSTPLDRPSERRYRNHGCLYYFHLHPQEYFG
jgi:hypothetical protein